MSTDCLKCGGPITGIGEEFNHEICDRCKVPKKEPVNEKMRDLTLADKEEYGEKFGLCGRVLSSSEPGYLGERVNCDGADCQLWIPGCHITKEFPAHLQKSGGCSEKIKVFAIMLLRKVN